MSRARVCRSARSRLSRGEDPMPSCTRSLRFALLLVAVSYPVAAQSPAGRPLAIEDYYRVKTVGGPNLSPDGKWVAYTVSTRVEATNGTTSEVWLVASDASAAAKRVSAEGADATGPAWLDDGRLRFTSAGRATVYDLATSSATDLSTNATASVVAGRGGGRG